MSWQQNFEDSLYKSFSSNLHGTRVCSVTEYMGLQRVCEVIWGCTMATSTRNTADLFVLNAIGFARIYFTWGVTHTPKDTLSESRRWPSSEKKWQSLCLPPNLPLSLSLSLSLSLYIYIYGPWIGEILKEPKWFFSEFFGINVNSAWSVIALSQKLF